jgi:hypothetical protein
VNGGCVVRLGEAERAFLADPVAAGAAAARAPTHARIRPKADVGPAGPGWPDERIAEAPAASRRTLERVRHARVARGLDAALWRRRPPARPRKLGGAAEARPTAVACPAPPDGRARRTLRRLAGRLVELEVGEAACPEAVRLTLKKTSSSPG